MSSKEKGSAGKPAGLTPAEMLQLGRWNTPTVYNGWEQVTRRDSAHECFNLEETRDFMPQMGPMVGRAVTVVCEPGNRAHKRNASAPREYREYVASIPGPKIAVVQDLDKPRTLGSYWGEVNANVHRALGCVGTVTDGAVRDVDEMTAAGFKALARRMCVGHAHSWPVRWGCEVEVFGAAVRPGDLVHADKHGFLVIPEEDQAELLEAAAFMDRCELDTMISAARGSAGRSAAEVLAALDEAAGRFGAAVKARFSRKGEW
jgi:4-hydroxy-4-methyl-2-oxoglutarate aldolase